MSESSRCTTNEFSISRSTTEELSELSNSSLTNNLFENYELLPSSSDSEQSEEKRASSSLREEQADNYATENISQNTLGITKGQEQLKVSQAVINIILLIKISIQVNK